MHQAHWQLFEIHIFNHVNQMLLDINKKEGRNLLIFKSKDTRAQFNCLNSFNERYNIGNFLVLSNG